MKFKDVYTAVMNRRDNDLNRTEMLQSVSRQIKLLEDQRKALFSCVFGRKRCISGRTSKFSTLETHGAKYGPWMEHLESERVLKKFDSVCQLHEKLSIVKKHLKIE